MFSKDSFLIIQTECEHIFYITVYKDMVSYGELSRDLPQYFHSLKIYVSRRFFLSLFFFLFSCPFKHVASAARGDVRDFEPA